MKSAAGSGPLPDGFVEPAVERDAFALGQANGLNQAPRHPAHEVLPLENQLLGRGGGRQEGEHERTDQYRDSDSGNQ